MHSHFREFDIGVDYCYIASPWCELTFKVTKVEENGDVIGVDPDGNDVRFPQEDLTWWNTKAVDPAKETAPPKQRLAFSGNDFELFIVEGD